jgi:hypothetical protein
MSTLYLKGVYASYFWFVGYYLVILAHIFLIYSVEALMATMQLYSESLKLSLRIGVQLLVLLVLLIKLSLSINLL